MVRFGVRVEILALLIFAVAGCSSESSVPAGANNGKTDAANHDSLPPPDKIDPRILAERSFGEAPMLAGKVLRGELPPVAERLPENPLVVRPVNAIGSYGGELRLPIMGEINQRASIRHILNDNLMKFERPLAQRIVLNLAESYEFSEDNCSATFRIRKGVRWSDGVPFTVDDYLFWYVDLELDSEARDDPFLPSEWLVDGKPIQMEKVDDLTLRITSHKPLGRILFTLCHDDAALPRHILSKYHPKYNPEADYEDIRNFNSTANRVLEPGVPRLSAWSPVQWIHGQRVVYERNPYYWKVDTAGNQLPYADRLVVSNISDREGMLLKFMNGETDFFTKAKVADLPTLKKIEAEGRVRINLAGPTDGPVFYLNWDVANPALRQAFRDKRVRIALSQAINREEINQVVYKGLLQPSGFSFSPVSPYSSEESLQQHAEFDLSKARALLDEAGYRDRDGDGIRELADGSPFAFTVDVALESELPDVCELVMEQWKALGIKTYVFHSYMEVIYDRWLAGGFEVRFHYLDASAEPLDKPHLWGIWKGKGPAWYRNAADDPPPWLAEVSDLFGVAMTTLDPDRLREVMERIRDLHTANIPAIGVGSVYFPWGNNVRLGNVPEKIAWESAYRGPEHSLFWEQLFVRP